jgi:hypothetical protein
MERARQGGGHGPAADAWRRITRLDRRCDQTLPRALANGEGKMPMNASAESPRVHASGGTISVRGRLAAAVVGATLALGPGTASAAGSSTDACGQANVPLDAGNTCQNQQQAAVSYNGSQTQGWAYYCGGGHTFFYGGTNGVAWNNTCFTEVENGFFESGSKEDGSFTNWCTTTQSLTVYLACYSDACDAGGGGC